MNNEPSQTRPWEKDPAYLEEIDLFKRVRERGDITQEAFESMIARAERAYALTYQQNLVAAKQFRENGGQ